eukprot:scaffold14214_cov101-Isochrysis_galbana.AAC.3
MFATVHAAGSSLLGLFTSCTTFDSTTVKQWRVGVGRGRDREAVEGQARGEASERRRANTQHLGPELHSSTAVPRHPRLTCETPPGARALSLGPSLVVWRGPSPGHPTEATRHAPRQPQPTQGAGRVRGEALNPFLPVPTRQTTTKPSASPRRISPDSPASRYRWFRSCGQLHSNHHQIIVLLLLLLKLPSLPLQTDALPLVLWPRPGHAKRGQAPPGPHRQGPVTKVV